MKPAMKNERPEAAFSSIGSQKFSARTEINFTSIQPGGTLAGEPPLMSHILPIFAAQVRIEPPCPSS